jgi:hypothetical protein
MGLGGFGFLWEAEVEDGLRLFAFVFCFLFLHMSVGREDEDWRFFYYVANNSCCKDRISTFLVQLFLALKEMK